MLTVSPSPGRNAGFRPVDASASGASFFGELMERISYESLIELVSYDPMTGLFINRVNRWKKARAGELSGHRRKNQAGVEYAHITINGRCYVAHQLAWLYVYGKFHDGQIDHINGIGTDNRISNLRECDQSQNMENLGPRKNNPSGFLGVFFDKTQRKWVASIKKNGICTRVKCNTEAEAIAIRKRLKLAFHKFNPTQRAA